MAAVTVATGDTGIAVDIDMKKGRKEDERIKRD